MLGCQDQFPVSAENDKKKTRKTEGYDTVITNVNLAMTDFSIPLNMQFNMETILKDGLNYLVKL